MVRAGRQLRRHLVNWLEATTTPTSASSPTPASDLLTSMDQRRHLHRESPTAAALWEAHPVGATEPDQLRQNWKTPMLLPSASGTSRVADHNTLEHGHPGSDEVATAF